MFSEIPLTIALIIQVHPRAMYNDPFLSDSALCHTMPSRYLEVCAPRPMGRWSFRVYPGQNQISFDCPDTGVGPVGGVWYSACPCILVQTSRLTDPVT